MTQVPRPIAKGRQVAGLLLVVTTAVVIVGIIVLLAWSATRPPTLQ